jgi:hypothetical protein
MTMLARIWDFFGLSGSWIARLLGFIGFGKMLHETSQSGGNEGSSRIVNGWALYDQGKAGVMVRDFERRNRLSVSRFLSATVAYLVLEIGYASEGWAPVSLCRM